MTINDRKDKLATGIDKSIGLSEKLFFCPLKWEKLCQP